MFKSLIPASLIGLMTEEIKPVSQPAAPLCRASQCQA